MSKGIHALESFMSSSKHLIKLGRKRGTPSDKLTAQQLEFCERYLSNGMNGAEAAREAGYKTVNGRQIARNLLTKKRINAFIAKRKTELVNELTMQRHELLAIMRKVLKFNLMKHAKGKGKGASFVVSEEQYDKIADLIGDCVVKVNFKETEDEEGRITRVAEVELMDKMRMYELALKYTGMIDDKGNTVNVNIGGDLMTKLLDRVEQDSKQGGQGMVVDGAFIEHKVKSEEPNGNGMTTK